MTDFGQPGEEKGFKAKIRKTKFYGLYQRLFSRHYTIERFGINLGILVFLISICGGFAVKNYYDYKTAIANNTALYTSQIETSKSAVDATVEGVYDNKAKTKSFIMLKFEDPHSIPLNPKKYQFFMCGEDGHGNYAAIQGAPAGIFYVFGTTGYMGIYLVNKQGFKPQILNIVGRINSQIVDTASSSDVNEGGFSKYDQFRIRFNPGAKHVQILKSLDKSTEPSVSDLYSELVLNQSEKKARRTLNNDLAKMQLDLNRVKDYENRLSTYDHLQVPKGPGYLRGDKIIQKGKNKDYYLQTDHTIPGGFNFNWEDGNIENGYIPDLIRKNHMDTSLSAGDFLTLMAKKRDHFDVSDDNPEFDTTIKDSAWRTRTGKKVDLQEYQNSDSGDNDSDDTNGSVSKQTQMNNDIQGLEQAWSTYINDKQKYQTTDLENLLELEATYRSINGFSAINDSSSVLKLY